MVHASHSLASFQNIHNMTKLQIVNLSNIPKRQLSPLHCSGHIQIYPPAVLVHVPPFIHGAYRAHSSVSRDDRKLRFTVCMLF